MILLFTDYGLEGPYLGQVQACLATQAPRQNVINLFADAPRHNPKASAYLLAAYSRDLPKDSIFCCVVDPGVGTFQDKPAILRLDGSCYVGPDNGLFDIVVRQASSVESWEITWRPDKLSDSFHGRDLYAPVCAMLANGQAVLKTEIHWQDRHGWPDDLSEVVYIDHFGNCLTGMRAERLGEDMLIEINGRHIGFAKTFSTVKPGQAFWYRNSNGLVEIAVNSGKASKSLAIVTGTEFTVLNS